LSASPGDAGLLESARGRRLLERSLATKEKVFGPEDAQVASVLRSLAGIHVRQGDYAAAEPLYRRTLAIRQKAAEPDYPEIAGTMEEYADMLRRTGRSGEAEELAT
jgi:Tetratricopeptide repeat